MIKNKEITRLEHSRVNLSITIEKEAVLKEYQIILKDLAKEAKMPGFRPGKVPPAVLENKYGEGIKAETAQKVIEDSLKTVFDEIEETPITFEPPELLEDYVINFDQDFSDRKSVV